MSQIIIQMSIISKTGQNVSYNKDLADIFAKIEDMCQT